MSEEYYLGLIKDLNLKIDNLEFERNMKQDEIDRLNNIINELENHFEMLKLNAPNDSKEFFEDIVLYIKKLKELKGDSNEKK